MGNLYTYFSEFERIGTYAVGRLSDTVAAMGRPLDKWGGCLRFEEWSESWLVPSHAHGWGTLCGGLRVRPRCGGYGSGRLLRLESESENNNEEGVLVVGNLEIVWAAIVGKHKKVVGVVILGHIEHVDRRERRRIAGFSLNNFYIEVTYH